MGEDRQGGCSAGRVRLGSVRRLSGAGVSPVRIGLGTAPSGPDTHPTGIWQAVRQSRAHLAGPCLARPRVVGPCDSRFPATSACPLACARGSIAAQDDNAVEPLARARGQSRQRNPTKHKDVNRSKKRTSGRKADRLPLHKEHSPDGRWSQAAPESRRSWVRWASMVSSCRPLASAGFSAVQSTP